VFSFGGRQPARAEAPRPVRTKSKIIYQNGPWFHELGGRTGYVVIALGSNVHIFARPHRRDELRQCFETVLGSSVRTVEFPGIDQSMLLVSFPGGGHLSIEFLDQAPDDEQPRLGAWLELRANDPAAVFQSAVDAGLTQVRHPGHAYYFMIPGGQVFTIAPAT
jgi:hypothetical protein